jgi:hypothetical protein
MFSLVSSKFLVMRNIVLYSVYLGHAPRIANLILSFSHLLTSYLRHMIHSNEIDMTMEFHAVHFSPRALSTFDSFFNGPTIFFISLWRLFSNALIIFFMFGINA